MMICNIDYIITGPSATPDARLKYIGKQKDGESSLADHGVRKYDSDLGQFTSIDPLWEKYYAWTPYHYCGNNPVMAVDPSGKYFKYVGTDAQIKKNKAIYQRLRDKSPIFNNTYIMLDNLPQVIIIQSGVVKETKEDKKNGKVYCGKCDVPVKSEMVDFNSESEDTWEVKIVGPITITLDHADMKSQNHEEHTPIEEVGHAFDAIVNPKKYATDPKQDETNVLTFINVIINDIKITASKSKK